MRSWTEKCGKLLLWIPSVFSAAPSLSLFFNGTVTTIQSHCPLPLNVYLKTSPFPYVAHWEKRWRKKRNDKKNKRQGEREREEKPPTGMSDQSQLPAKATHSSGPDPQSLPADKCKRSLIHAHTHTHTHNYSICSRLPYSRIYQSKLCSISLTHSLSRHRGSARCQSRMSVLECYTPLPVSVLTRPNFMAT